MYSTLNSPGPSSQANLIVFLHPCNALRRRSQTPQKLDPARVPAKHGLLQRRQTVVSIRTVDVDVVLCHEFSRACVVAFCDEVVKGAVVYLTWMGVYE